MPYAYDSGLTTFSTVIDVFDPDTASIQQTEIPILLASDVVNALVPKQDVKLFDSCIGATRQSCLEFWQTAEADWASNHPVIQLFGRI